MGDPAARYVTPRLRRVAAQLLAPDRHDAPTSGDLAASAERVLDTLLQSLGEVIGPAGVRAILLRAVKLRRAELAFLDERIAPGERNETLVETLRACLREQEPEGLRETAVMLFATFLGLLETVIGERLVGTLLRQIWPDTVPTETGSQGAEQ